jgi:hypothetical protein
VGEFDAAFANAGDRRVPQELNAAFFGFGDEPLVQKRPPQAHPRALRKIGTDTRAVLHEANAAKRVPFCRHDLDSQLTQRRQRFRHHALAARLVDGRRGTIRDDYAEALLAGSDGRGQPCRPASHYEYVGIVRCAGQSAAFLVAFRPRRLRSLLHPCA